MQATERIPTRVPRPILPAAAAALAMAWTAAPGAWAVGSLVDQAVTLDHPPTHWGAAPAADLVWQNDTSYKIVIWFMDKQGRRTSGTFTTPDAFGTWQVVIGPR